MKDMDKKELWERVVDFHGHTCPGLMIGFRAALYAAELLDLEFAEDEEIVCVAENDSCSVDAMQSILGCTVGKGNLLFRMRGKQAFSIYDRKTGESVRLVQKSDPGPMTRAEKFEYYKDCPVEDMFEVKKTTIPVPEGAKHFDSYVCECCGEVTGANWIRILDGKMVCLDCWDEYDRPNA